MTKPVEITYKTNTYQIHICIRKSYVFASGRNPIKAIDFIQSQVLEKLLPGDLQSSVAIWCRNPLDRNGDPVIFVTKKV